MGNVLTLSNYRLLAEDTVALDLPGFGGGSPWKILSINSLLVIVRDPIDILTVIIFTRGLLSNSIRSMFALGSRPITIILFPGFP